MVYVGQLCLIFYATQTLQFFWLRTGAASTYSVAKFFVLQLVQVGCSRWGYVKIPLLAMSFGQEGCCCPSFNMIQNQQA